MIKKLIGIGLLFFAVGWLSAQTTAVTATVVDSDSIIWASGSWKLTFVPNPTQPNVALYNINGTPLSNSVLYQSGSLSSGGTFSATIYQNTAISPSGSSWQLSTCPWAVTQCGTITFSTSTSTLDLSSLLTSTIPPPRFHAIAGTYGYADLEAVIQLIAGNTYYNVAMQCQRIYNGSTWSCLGSGGRVSGCVPSGTAGVFLYDNGAGACAEGYIDYGVTTPGTLTILNASTSNASNLGVVNITANDPFGLSNSVPAQINILATESGTTGAENGMGTIQIGATSTDVGSDDETAGVNIWTNMSSTSGGALNLATLGAAGGIALSSTQGLITSQNAGNGNILLFSTGYTEIEPEVEATGGQYIFNSYSDFETNQGVYLNDNSSTGFSIDEAGDGPIDIGANNINLYALNGVFISSSNSGAIPGAIQLQGGVTPPTVPTNSVQFVAASSTVAYNLTWPDAQGSGCLDNNGAGLLGWVACSGGGSITLTTIGTSGAATLTGTTLNIPVYTTTAAVSSVSNSDGSLTISPTTGAVVASLNQAHSFTLTGTTTLAVTHFSGITSGTQCLESVSGVLTGTGAACGSGGSSAFSALTGGTNTGAAMVVGSGASLNPSGTGTIGATAIDGVTVTGAPTSGQIIVASTSSTASWQTPLANPISGQTTGYLLKATSATGSTTSAVIDDGITTASTVTVHEKLAVNSGAAFSYSGIGAQLFSAISTSCSTSTVGWYIITDSPSTTWGTIVTSGTGTPATPYVTIYCDGVNYTVWGK